MFDCKSRQAQAIMPWYCLRVSDALYQVSQSGQSGNTRHVTCKKDYVSSRSEGREVTAEHVDQDISDTINFNDSHNSMDSRIASNGEGLSNVDLSIESLEIKPVAALHRHDIPSQQQPDQAFDNIGVNKMNEANKSSNPYLRRTGAYLKSCLKVFSAKKAANRRWIYARGDLALVGDRIEIKAQHIEPGEEYSPEEERPNEKGRCTW